MFKNAVTPPMVRSGGPATGLADAACSTRQTYAVTVIFELYIAATLPVPKVK